MARWLGLGARGAETVTAAAGSATALAAADSATSAATAAAISRATATIRSGSDFKLVSARLNRLSVPLGKKEGRRGLLYLFPFSPGWWLQPGLKTFGRFAPRA
jgi:hypothetical protein